MKQNVFSRILRWTLVCGVLFLILIVAAIWTASRRPKPPQVTLSDGRVVEFLGVTVGVEHRRQKVGPRAFFHSFIPVAFKKAFGPSFPASFGFGKPGVAVWLMCYDPGRGTYVQNWADNVIVVDDHGCVFDHRGRGSTGDGFHHAEVFNFSAYPRRQTTFTIRFLKTVSGNETLLGEMKVQNPNRSAQYSNWVPESFPSKKTNGSVVLRMNAFDPTHGQTAVIASKNGKHRDTHYEDVTGNSGPSLCTNEPAWKYRTTIFRTDNATFSTNELWTLRPMTMPAPGTMLPLQLTNMLQGFPIEVRYVGGPGSYTFSNDVLISSAPWKPGMSASLNSSSFDSKQGKVTTVSYGSANPFLIIARPHLGDTYELAVRLRDGDRVVARGESASGGGGKWFYDLTSLVPTQGYPAPGAPVVIDVILQEGKQFEFLVNPLHHFKYGAPR